MSSPISPSDRAAVRYELLERLGKGSSGTVWRARVHGRYGLSREVAIKIAEDGEETIVRRLRDEARLLGLVRHPSLVAVQDLVRFEDGSWGLVMELLDGVDLNALRAAGPLPPGVLMDIGRKVADVLDRAYNAEDAEGRPLGLMHRDVKPANVMICTDGSIKLLDFGIAKAQAVWRESRTLQGEVWGTVGYIPPERQFGHDAPTSDVYSLGVMLYQLSVGQRFGRAVPDPQEHALRVADAEDKMARAGLEAELRSLISRMMAFHEEERPSPRVVADALCALRLREPQPRRREWAARTIATLRGAKASSGWRAEGLGRILAALQDLPAATAVCAPTVRIAPLPSRAPPRRLPRLGSALGSALIVLLALLSDRASPASALGERQPEVAPTHPPAPVVEAAPSGGRVPRRVLRRPQRAAELAPVLPSELPAPQTTLPPPASVTPGPPIPVAAPPLEVEQLGTVMLRGDLLDLYAVSSMGQFPVPGALPAGDYELHAHIGDATPTRVGVVRVEAGEVVSVRCDLLARACR